MEREVLLVVLTAATYTDLTVANGPVSLAVRDYGGGGPDLLLLHGMERTITDVEGLVPSLLGSFRVVAMDFRNHGLSGDGPWTWDNVISDVVAVIREVGMSSPVVVGHSLGGMVAALVATVPDMCSGAVNLDGIGFGRPDQYVGMSRGQVRRRRWVLDALTRLQYAERFAPKTWDKARAAKASAVASWGVPESQAELVLDRVVVRGAGDSVVLRPSGPQCNELMRALDELDLFSVYAASKCPLLIVNCADPVPHLPSWIRRMFAAQRAGLARDYAALTSAHSNIQVVPMAVEHRRMLWDKPEEIAAIVRGLVQAG